LDKVDLKSRIITLEPEDTKKAVDKLEVFFQNVTQNVDQAENLDPIKKPNSV